MSSIKEEHDSYYDVAKDILKFIRAIEDVCDAHEDAGCRNNYMDENEVYAKATQILKNEYPEMNDFKLFHKCIDEVLNAATADYCPFCEKAFNE